MPNIKDLNFDEIAMVCGGSANGQDNNERSNYGYGSGSSSRGIAYSGQANGFVAGYNAGSDISKTCAAGIATGALGIIGSLPSRSPISIGSAVAAAGISIASTCNDTSSGSHVPFR